MIYSENQELRIQIELLLEGCPDVRIMVGFRGFEPYHEIRHPRKPQKLRSVSGRSPNLDEITIICPFLDSGHKTDRFQGLN